MSDSDQDIVIRVEATGPLGRDVVTVLRVPDHCLLWGYPQYASPSKHGRSRLLDLIDAQEVTT